jgi:hypothetical protein
MKTSSAKAKGRKLQNWVKSSLIQQFVSCNIHVLEYLHEHITTAIMGERGEDVKITGGLRSYFPFSIECKNQEKFKGIYKIFNQAKSHNEDYQPLVFIKMNGEKPLVILDAEVFIKDQVNEERYPIS